VYSNPQKPSSEQVVKSRCEGGRWLRELREARGLSQRQLADKVGVEYYSFISQLECGHGRIPPDRYRMWSTALDIEPRHFVRLLMHFYDPVTYQFLFDGDEESIIQQTAPRGRKRSTTAVQERPHQARA
jgi:transcriptional regulator with XRE-family HTH domain